MSDANGCSKETRGKRDWSLLPLEVFEGAIDVMQDAVERTSPPPYERDSWRLRKDWRRTYENALIRHTAAMQRGEELDPMSGFPHIDHAMACVAILKARRLMIDAELRSHEVLVRAMSNAGGGR